MIPAANDIIITAIIISIGNAVAQLPATNSGTNIA